MQMSNRITKNKHTVRPVAKPAGKKSRFTKPKKVKRRQYRETFTDLSQLKDKMEEREMRMGGTSVNATKIMKAMSEQPTEADIVNDAATTLPPPVYTPHATQTPPQADKPTNTKVGFFSGLRLGLRDTLMGQVVTAVTQR